MSQITHTTHPRGWKKKLTCIGDGIVLLFLTNLALFGYPRHIRVSLITGVFSVPPHKWALAC